MGEESDRAFRASIEAVAGKASAVPFAATLADLLGSWFAPVTAGDDGSLLGRLDGATVQLTLPTIRAHVRTAGVVTQLGVQITDEAITGALPIVARRARAEAERQAVADDARADHERRGRAEGADLAQRRAQLLRALSELDAVPAPAVVTRPVPTPPKRSWRKNH
ncbi:hypothetical protein GCM10027200_77420 [Lentzea nigeriaca]